MTLSLESLHLCLDRVQAHDDIVGLFDGFCVETLEQNRHLVVDGLFSLGDGLTKRNR